MQDQPKTKILVTGAAGFIGHAVSRDLMKLGHEVLGVDNLNDYYDVSLKKARVADLEKLSKLKPENSAGSFQFKKVELSSAPEVLEVFESFKPRRVVHLAAQPGVRYSLDNPMAYINSNIVAFTNILENCRYSRIEHLVFASSSSVYGANRKLPFYSF